MITKANSNDIDRIKATADIIEEIDGLTTYLGFCQRGTTDEAAPAWSIMKITQSAVDYPIVTRSLWAGGFCSYNLAWSQRESYSYSYKKF